MTPSCPSSRRRSSGRWRRLTEIWEQEDDIELQKGKKKDHLEKKKNGDRKRTLGLDGKFSCEKTNDGK